MTGINRPLHYNTEIPNDYLNIRLILHPVIDEIMFFFTSARALTIVAPTCEFTEV